MEYALVPKQNLIINVFRLKYAIVFHALAATRVLQKVLSLGSDYFSATF